MDKLAEYARIARAMSGAPAELPAGHPSGMLRDARDMIPQVQADDSSLGSGIASRALRTVTGVPRAGLETMANWLEGVDNPAAIRIGPDTVAPLGASAIPSGVINAMARPSRDWRMVEHLDRVHPNEPALAGALLTETVRQRSKPVSELVNRPPASAWARNSNRPGPTLVSADNATASAPGVAASAMQQDMARQRILEAMLARGEM